MPLPTFVRSFPILLWLHGAVSSSCSASSACKTSTSTAPSSRRFVLPRASVLASDLPSFPQDLQARISAIFRPSRPPSKAPFSAFSRRWSRRAAVDPRTARREASTARPVRPVRGPPAGKGAKTAMDAPCKLRSRREGARKVRGWDRRWTRECAMMATWPGPCPGERSTRSPGSKGRRRAGSKGEGGALEKGRRNGGTGWTAVHGRSTNRDPVRVRCRPSPRDRDPQRMHCPPPSDPRRAPIPDRRPIVPFLSSPAEERPSHPVRPLRGAVPPVPPPGGGPPSPSLCGCGCLLVRETQGGRGFREREREREREGFVGSHRRRTRKARGLNVSKGARSGTWR